MVAGAAWPTPACTPLTITRKLPAGSAKLKTQYDIVTEEFAGKVTVCCQMVRFGRVLPLIII
jgi:hypothetical protein